MSILSVINTTVYHYVTMWWELRELSILSQRVRNQPAPSMPVTYSQTPPPVVEEREGEVMVTPQLQQVNMVGFSGGQRGCMKLLVHQPAR